MPEKYGERWKIKGKKRGFYSNFSRDSRWSRLSRWARYSRRTRKNQGRIFRNSLRIFEKPLRIFENQGRNFWRNAEKDFIHTWTQNNLFLWEILKKAKNPPPFTINLEHPSPLNSWVSAEGERWRMILPKTLSAKPSRRVLKVFVNNQNLNKKVFFRSSLLIIIIYYYFCTPKSNKRKS